MVNSSTDRFDKVCEWTAFISSKMSVGYEEYRLKYDTEYANCVDIKIGPLGYLFGFTPVLTGEEIMEIYANMGPVTP